MPLPIRFRRELPPGILPPPILPPLAAVHIVDFDPHRDAAAVGALAAACRAGCAGDGGDFRPAGLVAELTGRPERPVRAWLARPAPPGGPALGLAAAVWRPSGPVAACSIAWLLVHPSARRRGIARALVGVAVAAAAAAGARVIEAETAVDWPAALGFWLASGFQRLDGPLPASGQSGMLPAAPEGGIPTRTGEPRGRRRP